MSDITLPRAAEQVRNFLHHLRKWDVLSIPNSDGAFWCREVDAALAALDAALAEPSLQVSVDPTAFTASAFSQAAVLKQAEAFETAYQTKRAALDAALAEPEPEAIARAVEAEREACAKVCLNMEGMAGDYADKYAAAIRARGNK